MQNQRQLINIFDISSIDDILLINVALARNLALQLIADGLLAATNNQIWLNTARSQLGDAVLCRLRLLLTARTNKWHQRYVYIANVVTTDFIFELANGLEERKDLDVANGSTNFRNHHINIISGQPLNASLNLISHVRNDLHSTT